MNAFNPSLKNYQWLISTKTSCPNNSTSRMTSIKFVTEDRMLQNHGVLHNHGGNSFFQKDKSCVSQNGSNQFCYFIKIAWKLKVFN